MVRLGPITLPILATLAACAADPEPPAAATTAVPLDRPLDAALGDPAAVRTAALIEVALAQVRPDDLRRCLDEFQQGPDGRFAPPAHGSWLIVASALPEDGDVFARRNEAAPEPEPEARRRVAGPDRLSCPAALDGCRRRYRRLPLLCVRL